MIQTGLGSGCKDSKWSGFRREIYMYKLFGFARNNFWVECLRSEVEKIGVNLESDFLLYIMLGSIALQSRHS